MLVKYKKLYSDSKEFTRMHADDACFDMYSYDEVVIHQHETVKIHTGIALELPKGTEGQVRPRSSTSKDGILVHFGTIDNNYRGEIIITATNLSNTPYAIHKGNRIAQLAIKELSNITMEETEVLSNTDRGDKGFGSTGK